MKILFFRFSRELSQSEQVWKARIETCQKQFSRTQMESEEEHQRTMFKLQSENESQARGFQKLFTSNPWSVAPASSSELNAILNYFGLEVQLS